MKDLRLRFHSFVLGNLKILPNICSTSILDVLFATVASIYAKGQSHPSFNALIVIIYLILQSELLKSIFFSSSLSAVLLQFQTLVFPSPLEYA